MIEDAFAAKPAKPKTEPAGKRSSSPSPAIRVLLADASKVVRQAVARLLNDEPDIEMVAEESSLSQAMQLADQLQPEVIVMDLHMGSRDGVTPSQVKSSFARAHLLAICVWTDTEAKELAESFGAAVLLNKADLAAELVPTIKQHAHR